MSVRARRLAVGGILVAIVAVTAPAIAAPNKGYTVDVAGTALAGRTTTFTVTFGAPAKQDLGSAKLTLPRGFTVSQVVADTTVPPTIDAASGTITLNGLEIPSGGTEDVTVRADVACTGAASAWSAQAKQANEFNGEPGNFLQLDTANSSLITPVLGVCVPCPEDLECTATQNNGNSQFAVTGNPNANPDAGQVRLAFGSGLAIDCAGYQEIMAGTALFDVSNGRSKLAKLIVAKNDLPRGGANALNLCFAAESPFTGSVEQGTFDWDGDGVATPVHVGLLANCEDADDTRCIEGRGPAGQGNGFILARLPPGDPGMRG